jgi:transcriptional antiterminator RfaH
MTGWYVAQTLPKAEAKALFHLRRQGFNVYLPQFLKQRRHARKTDWVKAPLFPQYMFVHFDLDAHRWRAIHSTVGINHLVCNGETPTPLPEGVVEEFMSLEDSTGIIKPHEIHPFKKGDKVRILAGAFRDMVGLFDVSDERDRITVLLDMLGRKVKVRLLDEAVARG